MLLRTCDNTCSFYHDMLLENCSPQTPSKLLDSLLSGRYERLKSTMTTSHKAIAEARELEDILAHKESKMARELAEEQHSKETSSILEPFFCNWSPLFCIWSRLIVVHIYVKAVRET